MLTGEQAAKDGNGGAWGFLSLLLVAVVFAVYHSVLSASFISFDDSVYVYDNPVIKNGFTVDGLSRIFSFKQEAGPYWHPVTSLSHMMDCQFFGLKPGLHHLSNLIIHALNVLLLFAFFRISTGKTIVSFFVALFFAVHPLNVETVAWISERKNLLAVFFFLLGLHAWRFHVIRRNGYTYLFLWLVFFLGIMSKPLMMTFPFALLLVHHFPLSAWDYSPKGVKAFLARNVREVKPVLQMIVVMLILFFWGFTMSGSPEKVAPLRHIPLDLRLSNMVLSYLVYLKALFLPFDLTVFRPYPESVGAGVASFSLLAVSGLTAFSFMMFRRLPWLFFGWFWYLGNLVTASGLIQKGYWPAWADRFTYLPMIGILVILVWGSTEILGRVKAKPVIFLVSGTAAAVFFAGVSYVQVRHWKNSETLFRHAVTVNPNDVLSLTNLALALGEQGRFAAAIDVSEKALSIEPRYAEALNNMGTLYAKSGDIAQSLVYFERALEAFPGFTRAKENADQARNLLGSRQPGESELRKILEDNPKSLDAAAELAMILVSKKQYGDAEKLYLAMLNNHPDAKVSILYNLACLYAIMGQEDRAMAFLENSAREGFSSWEYLEADKDLESLRHREDFRNLIRTGKKGKTP